MQGTYFRVGDSLLCLLRVQSQRKYRNQSQDGGDEKEHWPLGKAVWVAVGEPSFTPVSFSIRPLSQANSKRFTGVVLFCLLPEPDWRPC